MITVNNIKKDNDYYVLDITYPDGTEQTWSKSITLAMNQDLMRYKEYIELASQIISKHCGDINIVDWDYYVTPSVKYQLNLLRDKLIEKYNTQPTKKEPTQ